MEKQLQELLDERKNALEEASSRFEILFENSPLALQMLSTDGKTTKVNNAWKRLWDLSDEFVDNYILKEYNVLNDPILIKKGTISYLKRAFEGERQDLPEEVYDPTSIGKEGRKRITRPMFCPLKDFHGSVREVLLIHEDITEQREAVEDKNFLAAVAAILLESLDYKKTLEHIATATIPYLADGCQVDIVEDGKIHRLVTKHRNPEIEAILLNLAEKYPPTMGSPQPTARVIRSGVPELLIKLDMDIILAHTKTLEHAEMIRETNVKSHLAVPLKIRGETIGALNFWINSDRMLFNEKDVELAESISRYAALAIENARLYRDANKAISQREDFISIASHELKTPVTALMLQMEIIQSILKQEDHIDLDTLRKVSASSSRQLERLRTLIEDMLDLTRVANRKLISEIKDKVDLKAITLDAMAGFSEQLKVHNISLTLTSEENVFIVCDPGRVGQVIANLITNAILYGNKKPIEISLSQTEDRAIFKIKDYGRGIRQQDHKRIFDRFERGFAPTDGKGLGLGLFISRQIIEEQKGKIWVESEPGKGSTFIFELPRT